MTTPKNTKRPSKHLDALAEKLKTHEAPIPRNAKHTTKIATEWSPADHEQSTLRNKRTTKTKKDSGYMELAEGIMNGAPPANLRKPSETAKPAPRNVRTPRKFIADLMTCVHQKIASMAVKGAAAEDYEDVVAVLSDLELLRDRLSGGSLGQALYGFRALSDAIEDALPWSPASESLRADYEALLTR